MLRMDFADRQGLLGVDRRHPRAGVISASTGARRAIRATSQITARLRTAHASASAGSGPYPSGLEVDCSADNRIISRVVANEFRMSAVPLVRNAERVRFVEMPTPESGRSAR